MLDFIPKEYAQVLKMADLDGMKQADIAKELGLNLSTTKSRIQKARELLKKEFMICCHFETDVTGKIVSFEVKASCKPLQKIRKEIMA
ncbi:MAG: sigma factor-like helix-turn-helix DNA-binding protein [Leadbetterella sp.]